MSSVAWSALAFLAGITVFGLMGTLLELLSGSKLSFAPPFMTRHRPARFVIAPVLAGPMMLFNDALDAFEGGRISDGQFLACAATCLVWTGAMGVVTLEFLALAMGN